MYLKRRGRLQIKMSAIGKRRVPVQNGPFTSHLPASLASLLKSRTSAAHTAIAQILQKLYLFYKQIRLENPEDFSFNQGMKLLVVEDNQRIAKSLKQGLGESGYTVAVANDGKTACALFDEVEKPELIVLDLGLPDIDGMDLLTEFRKTAPDMPVIILTARGEIEDRVAGLDAGADDYLVKPFAFAELLARIRVLERRGGRSSADVMRIGDLELNPIQRSATRGDTEIDLTPREFDLLLFLAQHTGEPVSREMIARDVLNITSRAVPFDNIIDVHMSNLRKKVDADFEAKLIRTVRGLGFIIGTKS